MSPLFRPASPADLRVVRPRRRSRTGARPASSGYRRVGTCSTTTSGSSKSSRRAVTAATCASVASWTIDDRPVGRLAAVPIDDLAHARSRRRRARRRAARTVRFEVLGVLADDRDAVRVAVLDQHAAVAIEQHAARRAQRERPLVVVLGHLLELRVLHDLQHPEADGQHRRTATTMTYCSTVSRDARAAGDLHATAMIAMTCHRLYRADFSLVCAPAAARRRPGSSSTSWNATHADHARSPSACAGHRGVRRRRTAAGRAARTAR